MLLGSLIRKKVIDPFEGNRLGLHLDSSFTSYSVLKLFPYAEELMQGLVSFDVIAFQNLVHIESFVDMANSLYKTEFKTELGVIAIKVEDRLIILRIG